MKVYILCFGAFHKYQTLIFLIYAATDLVLTENFHIFCFFLKVLLTTLLIDLKQNYMHIMHLIRISMKWTSASWTFIFKLYCNIPNRFWRRAISFSCFFFSKCCECFICETLKISTRWSYKNKNLKHIYVLCVDISRKLIT